MQKLQARADLLARVRRFFADRGVMEVETPLLSANAATDPALASFVVAAGPGRDPLYLQTSPEFHMKRLLAAGVGDIYQITRGFRDGESGRRHNPEFTLIEWYRLGFDHWSLMDEVAELVDSLLPARIPWSRVSFPGLFVRHVGVDPLEADAGALARVARDHGVAPPAGLDRSGWMDLLFSHVVEPALATAGGVLVHDYPADQAALARLDPQNPRVARRFELYVDGVELANGFHELTDPAVQRLRFEHDNERRQAAGLPAVAPDERLLSALEAGLPDCAGVALGLDRLLMLISGARHIDEVLAFPLARA